MRSTKLPADFNTVSITSNNLHVHLKAADDNVVLDVNEQDVNDVMVALHLDHLLAVTYDPASQPGVADALFNEIIENDGGVSRLTENALEQGPTGSASVDANDLYDVWTQVWITSGALDPNFTWDTLGGLLKQAALKD